MRSTKQLLRQPLKFAAGILLVSLAVAILTICIGQYVATELTRENLDDRYDTIGLLADEYFWREDEWGRRYFPKLSTEIQGWIDETIQTRTDLVKTQSSTGLVSAYIPELTIDNFSRHEDGNSMSSYNVGNPYRCAMLTVTLTQIGTVVARENIGIFSSDGETKELLHNTTFLCVGTVEGVIGLEEGFESPVGKTIVLHITVYNREDFDALELQVGQEYLVYGMDYSDVIERSDINRVSEAISLIITYRDGYEELFGTLQKDPLGMNYEYDPMLEQFDCTMTVCDPSSLPWNYISSSGFTTFWDERPFYYQAEGGYRTKAVPADEYIADYQVPTITALNGSAEAFLASEEGALWQKKLSEMEISNHGFPVLCVDKLGYQAAFSRELARIVDGRDFSESELAGGEKVCVIAQSLATQNGLQIGDTIDLRTYAYDPNIYELQRNDMQLGTSFPNAAIYSGAMGFTSEMETYTIVGLYRQEDAWQNQDDLYGFTPNTIFVPKASVSAEMLTHEKGIYSTLVLENGKTEEFKALMAEAGYPDLFICYDQGYSEFLSDLTAYEEASARALYIGIAAYAVLMLLFVLLFPVMQRKALATMFSFGAPRGNRVRHVVVSSVGILLPGAVLGGFAGSRLWSQVAQRLMQSLNVEIPLEANMPVIAPSFAAAHLLLMGLVVLLAAVLLTRNNSVMKRK